jgi:Ni/Co efflux regulator RcnB
VIPQRAEVSAKGLTGEKMAKSKLLLLGVLMSLAGAVYAAPQPAAAPSGIQAYEEQEFIADFTKFKIGDTAPAMYQTPEYIIKQFQLRNLPAPDAGTHWTYMGENYVLINDADGKILKAYNGDIFYHR